MLQTKVNSLQVYEAAAYSASASELSFPTERFCVLYSVFCFFLTFPVAFCVLHSVFCDLALLPTPLEMVDLGFCDLALLTLAFGSGPVFCDSVFCDFATPDKVGTELSSVSVRMKWLIHRGIF